MQFLRSVCYNSFQIPLCSIRFFTNRAKSVILFYSEVFFSQPSFSEFLIFKLYKKLLSLRSGIKKENDAYVHSQNRCSFLQNKKSQKSLLVAWYTSDTFTNLNCVRISFPDDTNNNYIVSVTLYVVCVNIKTPYIVYPERKITIYRGSMDMENIISWFQNVCSI